MAIYTPARGGEKDGVCYGCGKPATTEMLTGHCPDSEAQYAELCDGCFDLWWETANGSEATVEASN